MTNLTWNDLRSVPQGTRVVFTTAYDIYPHCIVQEGTLATIVNNGLDSGFPYLDVLTDDEVVREALAEWDGDVVFAPLNSGEEWTDESPLALAQVEA